LCLVCVLFVASCAHSARTASEGEAQTPTQKAADALVAREKCGGDLTERLKDIVALAVQREGTAAVKAAEYSDRATWALAGFDADPALRDAMCAKIFRNGWLQ
jgi:hypothetical protein